MLEFWIVALLSMLTIYYLRGTITRNCIIWKCSYILNPKLRILGSYLVFWGGKFFVSLLGSFWVNSNLLLSFCMNLDILTWCLLALLWIPLAKSELMMVFFCMIPLCIAGSSANLISWLIHGQIYWLSFSISTSLCRTLGMLIFCAPTLSLLSLMWPRIGDFYGCLTFFWFTCLLWFRLGSVSRFSSLC